MAKPKLALIPSTVGGSVYSVLPSNGDGDFDFTRASAATRINAQGLIETVAVGDNRLNYPLLDGRVQTCPHLLLESQRTNFLTYSNDFSNAIWNKQAIGTASAPVVTSNYGISLDGTQNADRLQMNLNGGTTAGDLSYMTDYLTATGAATTSSVYIKSLNSITNIGIRTGSVLKLVDVGTEWQRFDVSDLTSSNRFQFVLYGHLNSQSADLLIYAAQTEAGSYATSYIPTQGSAVTRIADACSQTPPSGIIGQTEGVIFIDFEIQTTGQDMVVMNIYNTATPINGMYFYLTSLNELSAYVDNGGQQVLISTGVLAQGRYKAALAYKANDCAFYLNGSLVGTDVSNTIPPCGGLRLENYAITPTYQEKTEINQAQLYNTRLSNAELATLTTI